MFFLLAQLALTPVPVAPPPIPVTPSAPVIVPLPSFQPVIPEGRTVGKFYGYSHPKPSDIVMGFSEYSLSTMKDFGLQTAGFVGDYIDCTWAPTFRGTTIIDIWNFTPNLPSHIPENVRNNISNYIVRISVWTKINWVDNDFDFNLPRPHSFGVESYPAYSDSPDLPDFWVFPTNAQVDSYLSKIGTVQNRLRSGTGFNACVCIPPPIEVRVNALPFRRVRVSGSVCN